MARPLDGVRILDLTRLIPGPLGTLVLHDLGAQVDKVEDAGAGDYLRAMGSQRGGHGAIFAAFNRGKRSAVVDLKHPRGRDAFVRLAGGYDVLFEQFRPGVLDRLGIGHEVLRAAHPRLIICALTGYGQTGPLAQRAGHDLNYLARAGVLGLQGPTDAPSQVPGMQLADVAGGLWSTIAILAALRQRDATGEGDVLDISMTDGALGFAGFGLTAAQVGESSPRGQDLLTGGIAPYGTYFSQDGQVVTLASLEPKFWMKFATAVGLDPDLTALLPGDHQSALRAQIAAVFAARPAAEWEAFAAEHDCCVEVAVIPEETAEDPHLKARGMFGAIPVGDTVTPGFRTPVTPRDEPLSAPPLQGEHTRTIFAEAGFSNDEIASLLDEGAIRQA